MQTILAFVSSAFTGGSAAAAGSTAATAATTATTAAAATTTAASVGSQILGALKVGTTIVSALSVAGQADMQATALKQQAADQRLAARAEYIQSQEAANSIQRQFNDFVQQEQVVAAASGIDVGSGSVTEARQRAQADADRQTAIDRTGAEMNASIRQGRAAYLTGAAALAREGGLIGAASKAGSAYLDQRKTG
jgi:hypothetical protein